MKRPRIFISSTVLDFKDLRSSLKYWLEEFEYQVQLSEFNDFVKDLNKNSYDACLDSIEKVQYFILFIGSRVGGYFDNKKKISITQQEYRKACLLAKTKKLRLIIFVRQEIWDIKEDRKALEKYIGDNYIIENKLKKTDLERISNHSSKIINDAEFVFNFIDEVSKNREMKKALQKGSVRPTQNWIHKFSTFRDVVDVLKNGLPLSNRLSTLARLSNIKNEILNNLKHLISRDKKIIVLGIKSATPAVSEFSGNLMEASSIQGVHLNWLCTYYLLDRFGGNFSSEYIDEVLRSGELLYFNLQKKEYEESDLHKALFKLKNNMNFLKKNFKFHAEEKIKFTNKYFAYKNEPIVSIPNLELVAISGLYNAQLNILILSKYILAKIRNKRNVNFSELNLRPVHDFKDEADRIKEEDVALDEILIWIDQNLSDEIE